MVTKAYSKGHSRREARLLIAPLLTRHDHLLCVLDVQAFGRQGLFYGHLQVQQLVVLMVVVVVVAVVVVMVVGG